MRRWWSMSSSKSVRRTTNENQCLAEVRAKIRSLADIPIPEPLLGHRPGSLAIDITASLILILDPRKFLWDSYSVLR